MDDSDVATADVDVLVVGAGPTGLTLAAELATYGLRFRLVDRGPDRAHESRALAVQPRTLEVLDPVGVTDDLIARGNRAVQVRMHVGRRVIPIGLFDIGVDDTAYPYLLDEAGPHATERPGCGLCPAFPRWARGAGDGPIRRRLRWGAQHGA
jgi:choline dehydrogenase-like flavoprotein